jgi:hypothetical protein
MHHDMSSHIAVLCELFVAEVALERLLVLLLVPLQDALLLELSGTSITSVEGF